MGTRVDSIAAVHRQDSLKVEAKEQKENPTIEFDKSGNQNDYDTNTDNNKFLKEYIEGRAVSEGVSIPKGMKIKISNYNVEEYRNILSGSVMTGTLGIMSEKYWADFLNNFKSGAKDKSVEEYCKEKGLNEEQTEKVMELYRFHDIRVNVFKARIKDMFSLLSKNKDEVEQRVAKMKISDEQKEEIIKVKDFLDKYYKVEAEYNGKTYNLLNLSLG